MYQLCKSDQVIVPGSYWWEVNISFSNGLVPLGNKPLPAPMST